MHVFEKLHQNKGLTALNITSNKFQFARAHQIWSMIPRWSQKTHGLLEAVLLVSSCRCDTTHGYGMVWYICIYIYISISVCVHVCTYLYACDNIVIYIYIYIGTVHYNRISTNITCLNNYTIIRHVFLQDGNWIMTPNPKWENSLTQDHPTLQIWLVQHFLRWSSLKEAHCQHNRSPKDEMHIIFLQYVLWV